MDKLSTQSYKGVKDYFPAELRLRQWIFNNWREVCGSYGYVEYDASVLEPIEIYANKTSEEIVKGQTFSFEDRGGRKVTLRPEMTPTVSRMVAAKRQEMGYPLRLFSIPVCFRYERMQRGRNREFFQLNVDIFGLEELEADVEIIQLADNVMQQFKAPKESYLIKLNSRQLMDELFSTAQVNDTKGASSLIDKYHKITKDEFNDQLKQLCQKPELISQFLESDLQNLDETLKTTQAYKRLCQAIEMLQHVNVEAEFDPTVIRGFDYYKDIVFEVFDNNPDNNRAMFGGGRYGGLVENYGAQDLTTVGFGMGDATLYNFLESNNLLPNFETTNQVMVIPIELTYIQINKLVAELREKGVNVAVDYSSRKLEKRLKAAQKNNTNWALIVGEQELQQDKYQLKNLESSNTELLSISQIVETVQ